MSTLMGKTVANTYINLLQIGDDNQGISSTIKKIETGNGAETALGLSIDKIQVSGDILPSDHNTIDIGETGSGFKSVWIGDLNFSIEDVQEVKSARAGKYALAAQGINADNAVQRGENIDWSMVITTPTTLGGYGITDAATFTQGVKADSALQPGGVHFTNDVVTHPTTLGGYGITDAATFDQGVKADSALQPGEAATLQQGILADNSAQINSSVTFNDIELAGTLKGPATLTLDPAVHGDVSGKVLILGDLQVDGTTTTINSVSVSTADKQLILSQGATDAASSNGSGVIVEGSDASLTYQAGSDSWSFNKPVSNIISKDTLTIGSDASNSGLKIHNSDNLAGFEGIMSIEPRDVPVTQIGETVEFITHFKNKYDLDGDGEVVGTARHFVSIEDSLCIGNTHLGNNYKLNITGDGYIDGSLIFDTSSTDDTILSFEYNSTPVGYIRRTATSTSYLTTSDYRLKENVTPITDAIARIKQLPAYKFNFKSDKNTTVDGFLAHEVQNVVPEAVSGEKDGTEYQGIDQSKLVPLLVAAIKEQQNVIDQLKSRIDALESS